MTTEKTTEKKKLPKGCLPLALIFIVGFTIFMFKGKIADENKSASQVEAQKNLLAGIDSVQVKKEADSLLKKFIKTHDDFTKTTFYTHKTFGKNWNNRKTIRVIVRGDGSYYMESNYYGTDWITHTHVILLVDGITTMSPEILPISNEHKTDNTAYNIWESNVFTKTGDNNILRLISAAKEKEVKIRFAGGSYSDDAVLNVTDKKAISESLILADNLAILEKLNALK